MDLVTEPFHPRKHVLYDRVKYLNQICIFIASCFGRRVFQKGEDIVKLTNSKLYLTIVLTMFVSFNLYAQSITDPVYVPYFVIKRKTPNVRLPESLGGRDVKGFAGVTITVNSLGELKSTEIKKLKLSGKVNLSYQSGNSKNDTVLKYEAFLQKCVTKIKIIKTDKRKPPAISTITFLVKF